MDPPGSRKKTETPREAGACWVVAGQGERIIELERIAT